MTGQLVVPVDVETLLIDALAAWLPTQGWDVPVADKLAAGETTESVAVFRTGGPMETPPIPIDHPTIVIEAKGRRNSRSSTLINLCRAWFHALKGRDLGPWGVTTTGEFAGPGLLPVADSPTRYTVTLTMDIQAAIVG